MKTIGDFYKKHTYMVIAGFVAIAAVAGGGLALARQNDTPAVTAQTSRVGGGNQHKNGQNEHAENEMEHVAPLPAQDVSGDQATADQLTYLIEEEKLAHDVYQAMYEKWGSQVFGNIVKSEATHQTELLAVMQNRGVDDPRSDKLGVFTNDEIQALYDKLVAQGNQSQTEAYRVGKAIEELDIADIKKFLSQLHSADTDVKATFEQLMAGSEKHLAAFNRQLSR